MHSQRTPTLLPVDSIVIRPGHNPRTYFDESKLSDLVESIRTDGVIQAITVRRNEDKSNYELIAGERRWRASRIAGLTVIPAVVVEADDVTAQRMALVENLTRADLSVPEEAKAARSLLDAYQGDHEATARALGWSASKLSHRLLLLHATDSVMDALTRGQILVGHAELLAPLPADKQESALPLIVEHGLTIAQVKEQVLGLIALSLADAKFDLAGCQACPQNSDMQANLFETHIGGGKCANRVCYTDKTRAWVSERKAQLNETFGAVALLTEKEPGTSTPLLVAGAGGVGPEQMEACKGCASYGAILDDRMGATLGQVAAPTCFNLACHAEKVAAYQQAITPQPVPPPPAGEDAGSPEDEGDAGGVTAPARTGTTAPTKSTPAAAKQAATAASTPGQVIAHYDRVIRDAVIERLGAGAVEPILALAVYGVASLVATCSSETHSSVFAALGVKGAADYKHTSTVLALAQQDKDTLQGMLVQAAKAVFATKPEHTAFRDERVSRKQLAAALTSKLGWDVLPHMRVDKDFLSSHTVSGLEALMVESGFRDFYSAGEGGEKKYKALLGKGKKDLIDGILNAGFDFSAYLPAALVKHQKELTRAAASK